MPSLYDRHAPHLYALALRITGDGGLAASVVEEAFLTLGEEADEASLVRVTRDLALARGARRMTLPPTPTPRHLVEAVFYGGQRVSDLSQTFALSEATVRAMLRDGMAELRRQFAEQR
jgi:DNA-directed RNA polymerase specialized sigma24 family protein